jgi:hypothetical protein
LDAAAWRVSMKRSVRRLAWWEALVGGLVATIGILVAFLPGLIVGLVLLAAGVWNLWRTSINGMLVDGIAVILTGLFSGLAGLFLPGTSESSLFKGAITGLFQIVWGVRRIASWLAARKVVNDPEAIAALEALVRDVSRRKPKSDASVIEFRTGGLRKHRHRLVLLPEGVIGLLAPWVVRLEKRHDLWIEARGTTATGRTAKVRVKMSDLELPAEMPVEHFERYERWKLGSSPERTAAA